MFFVSQNAPAPVVIGLDLVIKWPLFLNPVDKCLYFPASQTTVTVTNSLLLKDQPDDPSFDFTIVPSLRESNSEPLQVLPFEFTIPSLRESNPDNSITSSPSFSIEDANDDVLVECVPDMLEEEEELTSETSFVLQANFLMIMQRNSVTASGFAEKKTLSEFKSQLPPLFREVVNEFPKTI